MFEAFSKGELLSKIADPKKGMDTADNDAFLRLWWEVSSPSVGRLQDACRWVWYNKGGSFRRWYGNNDFVIKWENDGEEIRSRTKASTKKPTIRNEQYFGREGFTWSAVSTGGFSARYTPPGAIFDSAGSTLFADTNLMKYGALLNSSSTDAFLRILAPTINIGAGSIGNIPVPSALDDAYIVSKRCIEIAKNECDSNELSYDFIGTPLRCSSSSTLMDAIQDHLDIVSKNFEELRSLEEKNNEVMAQACGLMEATQSKDENRELKLKSNSKKSIDLLRNVVEDYLSYFVGCLFGRYSLDVPGLVLASQGETLEDYLVKVPEPSFAPDRDNVVPVLDGQWFQDDIVSRFRQFLRASFGEEQFEENLRFIEDALGKSVRDYFVKDFYKNHLQRYKKRPIYWMFSSPRGSFNALIYMHRYNPSTVSTVLNEYLREFQTKLEAEQRNQESFAISVDGSPRDKARAEKEVEKIRKMLTELKDYERDVLYPLAAQQKEIDLDDGVLVNYLRFGKALAPIKEIEKKRSDVEKWEWPTNKLEPTDE